VKRHLPMAVAAAVAVLALAASAAASPGGIAHRSAARDSAAPAPAGQPTKTTKVVRDNGVMKTVTTVKRGKTTTVTTTFVKDGKRYVVRTVKRGGRVVSSARQVSKVSKVSHAKTRKAKK
jgi:hypothetical protein